MGARRRSVGAFVLSARTTSAIAADIPHWGPFSTNWVFGVQGMIDVGTSNRSRVLDSELTFQGCSLTRPITVKTTRIDPPHCQNDVGDGIGTADGRGGFQCRRLIC